MLGCVAVFCLCQMKDGVVGLTEGKHLIDVHNRVGQGFAFTFPDFSRAISPEQPWYVRQMLKLQPVVKIDHILVSEHFSPHSSYVVPQSHHSDHRPVVAELLVNK